MTEALPLPPPSRRRLPRPNASLVVGIALTAGFLLVALLSTVWLPHNPNIPAVRDRLLPPERSFVPGPGVQWRVPEDVCGGGPTSHGGMAVDPRTHALVAGALGGAGGC